MIFSLRYAFDILAADLNTPQLAFPSAGVGGAGLVSLLPGRESQEDGKVKT